MSLTTPTTPTSPFAAPADRDAAALGGRARRLGALVIAETRMLLRNRTALFTALALPVMMAVMFSGLSDGLEDVGVFMVTALLATSLLFVVYYTLVTSLVARREQLVLKRLIAGEPTRLEVLLAPAVPLWGLLVLQSGVGTALAVGVMGEPLAHPWVLLLAVVGGATTWTALAIWCSTWTRTAEAAQLTTMPFMLVAILLSGFSLPLSMFGPVVERLAQWLPMTPVVGLTNLAFTGTDAAGRPIDEAGLLGTVVGALLPLLAWAALALYEGLRSFRWDARS